MIDNEKNVIEIKEDVQVGDYMLEAGDKIEVLEKEKIEEKKLAPAGAYISALSLHLGVIDLIKEYLLDETNYQVFNVYSNLLNEPIKPTSVIYLNTTGNIMYAEVIVDEIQKKYAKDIYGQKHFIEAVMDERGERPGIQVEKIN